MLRARIKNSIRSYPLKPSGGGFDPSASAVISQMTANGSTPSEARQVLINQLVLDLKGLGNTGSADIWSLLDVLQIYAAEDSIQALTEWKIANGSLDAAALNSPTFTVDVGYTSALGTKVVDTNFQPNTDGVNYTLNSASFGVYYVSGNFAYSGINEATNFKVWIRNVASSIDHAFNDNGFNASMFNTNVNSLQSLVRTSSTSVSGYSGGTLVNTISSTALNVPVTYNFYIGGLSGPSAFGNPAQFSIFYAGGDISSYMTQLNNSFNAYLSAL